MATAHMLGLDKTALSHKADMVNFVVSCQVPPPFPSLISNQLKTPMRALTEDLFASQKLSRWSEISAKLLTHACNAGSSILRGCSYTECCGTFEPALAVGKGLHFRICVQTYEGGLGGEPENEAHGGYTFCGLAALMLVGQAHQLNLGALLFFAVKSQVSKASVVSSSGANVGSLPKGRLADKPTRRICTV